MLTSHSPQQPQVVRLEPNFECYFRGSLYPTQSSREMRAFCLPLRKVREIRSLLLTIFYLILLVCPVTGYPRQKMDTGDQPQSAMTQNKEKVTIQTTGCKPLTVEELKARMGLAWDDATMRNDYVTNDDDVVPNDDKRNGIGSSSTVIDKNQYYLQGNIKGELGVDRLVKNLEHSEKDTTSVQSRLYMRRRKRDADDNENTNSPSDTRFLYQNMLFETISRRKSRQKRSSGSGSNGKRFKPAWECEIDKYWTEMPDYFPRFVYDGKCTQKACFFGLYRCKPVKYTIKLLRRDPESACNPVPLIGNTTTYEEKWIIHDYETTVACECGLKDRKGGKGRKSKKNRSRNRDRDRD